MTQTYTHAAGLQVESHLYDFVQNEVLAQHPNVKADEFWADFAKLLGEFAPRNRALLQKRDDLQAQIDAWHAQNPEFDAARYQAFLREIGYLTDAPAPFQISTANVDRELSEQAGRNWLCRLTMPATRSTPPMRVGAACMTRSTAPMPLPKTANSRPARATIPNAAMPSSPLPARCWTKVCLWFQAATPTLSAMR
uniref:Malate synthase N-terminal domain-containing protein n=1 Tax=Conchiformibius kuhniae TaxID=211502 RepID=A0A8T9MSC7_9NEIS|nr:hypothetical protein LVJ77_11755 [Conchiformibius kuhniae]